MGRGLRLLSAPFGANGALSGAWAPEVVTRGGKIESWSGMGWGGWSRTKIGRSMFSCSVLFLCLFSCLNLFVCLWVAFVSECYMYVGCVMSLMIVQPKSNELTIFGYFNDFIFGQVTMKPTMITVPFKYRSEHFL